MSRRKLVIVAGALVLIGGAAAIAAVGERQGRSGDRGAARGGFDLAQMGDHGWGERGHRGYHGRGEGRWHHGYDGGGRTDGGGMRGRDGRDPDMRRGWLKGSVTADEFDARVRERFARLDKNSDGIADAAEIEAGIGQVGDRRRQMRERMHERFASRLDADRDGKVTRQEVLDRVRKQFSRMDLDGDGRITDADLPPVMRGRDVLKGDAAGFGRGRGMAGGLSRLRQADANRDGIVTLDEMLAAAGRRFDVADRNKDGAHDKDDRELLDKETTAYRVQRFVHLNGGKDGRVTREQFAASAKERFAERDLNRDGRIDRDDGRRGRGRGRDEGQSPEGWGRGDRGPTR
jgi:Ca2+-binding EF-hand superfamily protein